MMKNRLFACSMALAGALLFTANLVGSDQPIPSTVIDIIAGYAAEESAIVIPTAGPKGPEPDYYDVTFQGSDQLEVTELYTNGHDVTVYTTPYTKQKSRGFWNSFLGYIKGQTTRTESRSEKDLNAAWDNKNEFIDEFRKRNPQNIPWRAGTDYQHAMSEFNDEQVKKLITLPAKGVLNISASNLNSHKQAPKIAVSTWKDSTIYSFEPSKETTDVINETLNARFILKDRARRSNTATRKALLAGIALTGAAAAYTASKSK